MFRDKLTKDVFKTALWIVAVIVACRFTKGYATAAVVLWACYGALAHRTWVALAGFMLFPLFIVMNGAILPKSGSVGLIFRVGTAVMAFAFLISASSRRGGERIPLGGLFLFLVVATISSTVGYFPMISYLKEVNFLIFLLGVWMGTRNIHHRADDLYKLRCLMLAIIALTVYGTYLTLPFPGIAYPQNIAGLMMWGGLGEADAIAVLGQSAEPSFLAGIASHSNTLAPMLACSTGLLMCDLFFVERKMTRFHTVTLLAILPLLYLTRSRGALVSFLAAVTIVYTVGTSGRQISAFLKGKVRAAIIGLLFVAFLGALFLEAKDNSFSKYLRKETSRADAQAGLTERLTASRMGVIERSLDDFRQNPFFGMGFQTVREHRFLYDEGMITIYSAPIEKGVLPTMVLGETGIVGAMVFFIWLLGFWSACKRKQYICTLCLMGVLLATNLGEASFFSPGGLGGILWILTVVGGFLCDMQILHRKNIERGLRQMMGTGDERGYGGERGVLGLGLH